MSSSALSSDLTPAQIQAATLLRRLLRDDELPIDFAGWCSTNEDYLPDIYNHVATLQRKTENALYLSFCHSIYLDLPPIHIGSENRRALAQKAGNTYTSLSVDSKRESPQAGQRRDSGSFSLHNPNSAMESNDSASTNPLIISNEEAHRLIDEVILPNELPFNFKGWWTSHLQIHSVTLEQVRRHPGNETPRPDHGSCNVELLKPLQLRPPTGGSANYQQMVCKSVNPECLLVKRSTLQRQVDYYVGMTSDGLRSTTSMSLGIDREELSDDNRVLADSVVGPAELMAWIVEIRMWRFRWWSTAKEKIWTSAVMPDERGSGRRAAALYRAQVRGRHPVDDIHIPGPDAFLLIDQLVDFPQLPADFQSWYDASPDYQKITRGQLQFRGEVYNVDSHYGMDEGVPMAEEIEIEPMSEANQALYHQDTPAAILFRQVRWFRTLAPRAKEMERRTLAYRRYRQGNERDGMATPHQYAENEQTPAFVSLQGLLNAPRIPVTLDDWCAEHRNELFRVIAWLLDLLHQKRMEDQILRNRSYELGIVPPDQFAQSDGLYTIFDIWDGTWRDTSIRILDMIRAVRHLNVQMFWIHSNMRLVMLLRQGIQWTGTETMAEIHRELVRRLQGLDAVISSG
ncbi:uncharacterized protein MYCGRDRAFT_94718 [Zymoseptoria tritici IPO323]|uniref:Uncharacterized protein n=1 Tax=Zymoseptoria tritici (strain CBS 115943 / IPO323) TaxID=336722 RepID=F9XET4_ZYMTI|nr:uncharacterized protein MYCGRDRAFT_94718 [Zymoseptoria tritici IPO323]EGP85822.1 hypothetical protein MYCGRDRAFT_94718 [Zymoseptoria tritici IPO323]